MHCSFQQVKLTRTSHYASYLCQGMAAQTIKRVPRIQTCEWKAQAQGVKVSRATKQKTPCVRALCNGYTDKRRRGNNDELRGGGDGVNHWKKLYSQGLYRTFETATET